MSIRILTHNGVENTNIDGARDYNFNTNGKSGVLKGVLSECDLSVSERFIVVGKGELRLAGHRIVLDEQENILVSSIPSTTTQYSVVAKLIVLNTQPEFSFDLRTQPIVLTQDNLYTNENGDGTYEIEIGTFELDTNGNILNLTKTVESLEINSGSSLTEEEKAKLNTIKTDGNGDKYLSDDGTYKEVKSGSSVVVDSELSTESENPVQNKVITEALDNKLESEDLTNYVKNTDYATGSKGGVGKISNDYGFAITEKGYYTTARAAGSDINARTNNFKPIVPMNLNFAVMKALTEPTVGGTQFPANWTDEDKAKARTTIGATAIYKHTVSFNVLQNGEQHAGVYINYYSLNTNNTFDSSNNPYLLVDVDGVISTPIITIGSRINPKFMKLRDNDIINKLQYSITLYEYFGVENLTVDETTISHSYVAV